jgi:hypothetical protein
MAAPAIGCGANWKNWLTGWKRPVTGKRGQYLLASLFIVSGIDHAD